MFFDSFEFSLVELETFPFPFAFSLVEHELEFWYVALSFDLIERERMQQPSTQFSSFFTLPLALKTHLLQTLSFLLRE